MLIYLTASLTALLALILYFKTRSSLNSRSTSTAHDPYGLFHLSLNKLPDEDPNAPPKTEWLNMGYWKVCRVERRVVRLCAG